MKASKIEVSVVTCERSSQHRIAAHTVVLLARTTHEGGHEVIRIGRGVYD